MMLTTRTRFNPRLCKSYDLRGTVGETLTTADAFGVGLAFAAMARARGLSRIAVSRDGRLSSSELEAALVEGLIAGGAQVFRMPVGPTPLVSFTIHRLGLDGGVMVTGSHLPPDQNGFKLMLGGDPVFGEALGALWEIEAVERAGGGLEEVDLTGGYLDAILTEIDGLPIANAAWDSGNGATGAIVEALVARLPGRQQTLFTEIDGTFPNHHADPSVPETLADLSRTVVEQGLDLGFAFDGDGDRVGVVDSDGAILCADQLLLLLARDMLDEQPGTSVVGDVKSSDALFGGIEAAGGRAVMSPSGYVLVRDTMLCEGAPLAGEMSGHIFFGDRWHHADDGIYNAVRCLRALVRSGTTLAEFRRELPITFATPEVRLPCPDERKDKVLRAIELDVRARGLPVNAIDGLRVSEKGGWWLLRASGTEPKLTARCEARTWDAMKEIAAGLAERLRKLGLDPAGLD